MDADGVSGLASVFEGGGGDNSRPSPTLTWAEFAEQQCPYYVAMGLPAAEYWHGDYNMLKYYRQAWKIKREQDDYNAWWQGLYIYDALSKVAPFVKSFSKLRQPLDYPFEPYTAKQKTEEEKKREEMRSQQERNDARARQVFEIWTVNHNIYLAQKQQQEKENPNDTPEKG